MDYKKRDFREETLLNAAEFSLLKALSNSLGQSKSATLRYCLHVVGDQFIRNQCLKDTGLYPED